MIADNIKTQDAAKIKPGCVVRLNGCSHTPRMTVGRLYDDSTDSSYSSLNGSTVCAECCWFGPNDIFHCVLISIEALVLAE